MVSEAELRIEVIESFTALIESLATLNAFVKKETALIAWVQDAGQDPLLLSLSLSPCPRERGLTILNQLQYLDQQAPREILVCAGFIGASPDTLDWVKTVNLHKTRFKKSILALKSAKIPKTDKLLTEKMEEIFKGRAFPIAKTLKKLGLSRLHLKQCYRQIPLLDKPPQKISWTWAHTRSIKRISIAKAQELLLKRGDDAGIQIQLQKLNQLSAYESLAIVQELAPHLRANIVFSKEENTKRRMIKGPVPIFFPCQPQMPFPQFTPPPPKCGRNQNRLTRSDVKLESTIFLPAIRAHRYTQKTS